MKGMGLGNSIYELAERLWPINRSITGDGVRETLNIIKEHLPELVIHEVPTGTEVFDWTVPEEWSVKSAWIKDSSGNVIVDFSKNNLHLVGYSVPVHKKISLNELQNYLYSIPELPEAIPYITSYYNRRWGFCLSENQRKSLHDGEYEVFIDSKLFNGSMSYGELILPGKSKQEILLSTYICHPSMANNELSGPCVVTFLSKWIKSLSNRTYTYRILFIPETIGSIAYLSKNLKEMKENTIAGFIVNCIGDNLSYSFLPSRYGNTLADKAALHVLRHNVKEFKHCSYMERGSDERQYCSPGVDLPVVSIMRTKYADYPEYHTSLDDLNFISPEGLEGGYEVTRKALEVLENNVIPLVNILCEPQLGKRNLYPTLSTRDISSEILMMMDLIAYSDGQNTLLEIAELINRPLQILIPVLQRLVEANVITLLDRKK